MNNENKYDFVIIDCPPTLGVLTVNAIYTADVILIPTTDGRYSLDGIVDLFDSIEEIKGEKAYKYWIIRNMFDARDKITNNRVDVELKSLNTFTTPGLRPRNTLLIFLIKIIKFCN